MKTFQERLDFIIKKDFFGKPANLAKTANLNNSLLSRWLNGVSTPTLEKLASIEKLGYSVQWLLYGFGDMKKSSDISKDTEIILRAVNKMSIDDLRNAQTWFKKNSKAIQIILNTFDNNSPE